jgi:hypothetical protein
MIYHILFWTLCAVLVAHVIVAVIAVIRAYRHEGRLFFSKPIFQNGHETQRTAFSRLEIELHGSIRGEDHARTFASAAG